VSPIYVAAGATASSTLAVAYAIAGRVDEAISLVAPAVAEFRQSQFHSRPAFVLLAAGNACLSAGLIDEATAYATDALMLARQLEARAAEAQALCLIGDVTSARGATDAEVHYREALTLAGGIGMRPLVAHCHFGLGKLYRRTGKREQAQEHLTTVMMYREMGMTYWLEKAEPELGS
jgi:tetratricopeptide (TPR) repeat protein